MKIIEEVVEAASYRSTRPQLEAFLSGNIWADMSVELELWKSRAAEEFDLCTDLRELGKIQGRRETIDYILGLPEMLIQSLTDMIQERRSGQSVTTQLDLDGMEGLEDG